MITCLKYRKAERGALVAFVDLFVDKWGLIVKNCTLHKKDGKRWINFPKNVYYDIGGEKRYQPILIFKDKKHYELFSKKAKEAVDLYLASAENKDEKPAN